MFHSSILTKIRSIFQKNLGFFEIVYIAKVDGAALKNKQEICNLFINHQNQMDTGIIKHEGKLQSLLVVLFFNTWIISKKGCPLNSKFGSSPVTTLGVVSIYKILSKQDGCLFCLLFLAILNLVLKILWDGYKKEVFFKSFFSDYKTNSFIKLCAFIPNKKNNSINLQKLNKKVKIGFNFPKLFMMIILWPGAQIEEPRHENVVDAAVTIQISVPPIVDDNTRKAFEGVTNAVRLNDKLDKKYFLKNVSNDFAKFNKLTQELDTMIRRLNGESSTYTTFQSDLNQTMTNTFKWKLSFFEELAKSKSNMDTLILDTNLLQNMIEDLPKNINKNNNVAQKNQKTKQMLDEIEKWTIKIKDTFNNTLTSWRTLANEAATLKLKWETIAEHSERFRCEWCAIHLK
ncbi:hypothetical protein RFI_39845 [Reticulomyxa filosa]|uniref:Uncharacterized protein n=1 Tax=Reticulomyxa filosa TaxID=46433 RepID=X6L876_RETFI|nr:hypothetical protein RFI_39845 [Reticulomyxa filosa]|eukprot:ETN97680.1 hypothetical protein RFI_39845 [Reticulomyxa filosa]